MAINKLNRIFCATALWAVALVSYALPARPGLTALRQPDGSSIEVRLCGDEHGNYMLSADGATLLQRDARGWIVPAGKWSGESPAMRSRRAQSPLRIIGNASNFPAHGQQRALAILVDFPATEQHPGGKPFMYDQSQQLFNQLFNGERFDTMGATGSVHQYFYDNSQGVFDLTFDVYGPVTLQRDMSFYSTKTNGQDLNAWNMVVEACAAIDGEVDFKNYDRDNDGVIDNVYIIYAGAGAATGGDPATCIWQHAADVETITGRRYEFDGLRLNHYACSNEYRAIRDAQGVLTPQLEGIGTVVHEFSHVMGLPDLYDTRGGAIFTPGLWSLMDTGCHLNDSRTPPLMSAYERSMLGWLDPRTIGTKPETVTLRSIADNEACRIATASNPNEYFVLENRQQRGWDAYLPGHGLLIWHINYMPDYWAVNQVNTINNYLGVDLLRADGQLTDGSLSGDTYPGTANVTTLTDEGYPNMRSLDNKPTNAPLSNIREAAGLVSFDICRLVQQLDRVQGLTATELTPTGARLSWQAVSQAGAAYAVNVYTDGTDGQPVYAGVYHDLIVADTAVVLSGLLPDTDYRATVTAVHGQVRGQSSEPMLLHTPPMSFGYLRPVALEADVVGERQFTARWQALDDAADYLLDVYTRQQGEPDRATVDFTGGLEQLPGGWSTNCSFTIGMSGYYGQASPALSMGDDYARLQSPVMPGRVRGVEFWYRERSGSGTNHVEVSALTADGWQLIADIALPTKMSAGETFSMDESDSAFPTDASAVKIVYRRDGKGTLAVDDVCISYNDRFVTVPLEGWTGRSTGLRTDCTVDGLVPSTAYYYSVRAVAADGTPTLPSNEVAVTTLAMGAADNVVDDIAPTLRINPDGSVTVDGSNAPATIYTVDGQRLHRLPSSPGIYLLRHAGKMYKVCR